ncbi:hypothetical protein D0269_24585, partial [Vibrio alginolyticus]|nr:hypothetical protein [Vibrio alginolyticus]
HEIEVWFNLDDNLSLFDSRSSQALTLLCPKVCFGIRYNLLSKLIGISFEVERFQFYYLNLRHLKQVRLMDKEIYNQVRLDNA